MVSLNITLIASLIVAGYNLSQFLTSYEATSDKVKEFKEMAKEAESDESSIKRTNMIMSGGLSFFFLVMAYLSDFTPVVLLILAAKFAFSLVLSNKEISNFMNGDELDKSLFKISRVDHMVNVLLALAVAVIVVA